MEQYVQRCRESKWAHVKVVGEFKESGEYQRKDRFGQHVQEVISKTRGTQH